MYRFASIQWEIVYSRCTGSLDLDLQKKINIQNCVNSTRNCGHYMYGFFGFGENLNIQNSEYSIGNCVQYMCELFGFTENLNFMDSLNV